MIDLNKIQRLPPVYIDDPKLTDPILYKPTFDEISLLVVEYGLDDKIWSLILQSEEKIQSIGVAIIAFGKRYTDKKDKWKKYLVQACGYFIKYSGKYLDRRMVTIDELEESRK